MTKSIAIIEGRTIRRHTISKWGRPMCVIDRRLYRTDDDLFLVDRRSADAMIVYDVDGTQPYGVGDVVENDVTMAMIDIARSGKKGGQVTIIHELIANPMVLIYGAIAGIILLSVAGVMRCWIQCAKLGDIGGREIAI